MRDPNEIARAKMEEEQAKLKGKTAVKTTNKAPLFQNRFEAFFK